MKLPAGIYEQVVNESISELINDSCEIDDIDPSDGSEILSRYTQKVLKQALSIIKENASKKKASEDEDEKTDGSLKQLIDACNNVIDTMSKLAGDKEILDMRIDDDGKQLKAVIDDSYKNVQRPLNSVSISSLFTGGSQNIPMYQELGREIESSDEVLLLVSFIRTSGINLIFDNLERLTSRGGRLRVLTTTYTGATEAKAVKRLAMLPNTEVKISYDSHSTRLHAKSYIFKRNSGFTTMFIGSSNLSRAAIGDGMEWNVKVTDQDASQIVSVATAAFETYWNSPDFEKFDPEKDMGRLSKALTNEGGKGSSPSIHIFDWVPKPFQEEILEALEAERTLRGSYRNLVVAATGTGKTVISAFDYLRFRQTHDSSKILYIAHRKEILEKSLETYRSVLRDWNWGAVCDGTRTPGNMDYVFMTIETFANRNGGGVKDPSFYDYIVVDEVHHGMADSYREVFKMKPKIMLGLTATPERMDGLDIRSHFNNRIAAEVRLPEAIDRELLVPFHYFAVTDPADISGVKFTRGKFDTAELSKLYIDNLDRTRAVINAVDRYGPGSNELKALGFCVSKEHARYMADAFNKGGIESIALTSDSPRDERDAAPRNLRNGKVKVIFTVDLYNEGIDIPEVNTVLFLRPTESLTIFIQQLGRGLRTSLGKTELTALDFVGRMDAKYRMYQRKMAYMTSSSETAVAMQVKNGFIGLPAGCSIKMEEEAQNRILKLLSGWTKSEWGEWVKGYLQEHGTLPKLGDFLAGCGVEARILYKKDTFTDILSKVERKTTDDKTSKFYRKGFAGLSQIDSKAWIDAIRRILSKPQNEWLPADGKFATMLYYSFHEEPLEKEGYRDVCDFIQSVKKDPRYLDELMQLLQWREDSIMFIEGTADLNYECALRVHCSYTRQQMLSGLGITTLKHKVPSREGVYYDEASRTDLLLINLNKSEKDFSATTMYEDYAISENLFHWQSQSTTSKYSKTGTRYINQRKNGTNVLLFAREHKTKDGITMPFVFLGKGNFVSSEGSKPMNIVWEMESRLPRSVMSYSPIRE